MAQSIPPSLLAAELYTARPTADTLRDVLESIGGFGELELGRAAGAFDVVGFDPADHDRLLASVRSSYGDIQNQDVNELWTIDDGRVVQALWSPQTDHDFANFNADGTITMSVHGGGEAGFAPRTARTLNVEGRLVSSSGPLYAGRFAYWGGTVFALTDDGDYYSNDSARLNLVADDGVTSTVLGSAATLETIDTLSPGLLIAYPTDREGETTVWDITSLAPLPDHPFANRPYRRIAISTDQTVAVAATFDD